MWTPARLHVTINIWIWWNKGHWGSNLEMPTWDPYNGRALARQLWNRGQLQTRTAMKELWDSCRTEYRSDLQWDWTPDLFGTSVKCPKSQSQQMPKHMVHPQGNGIAQNTKYEEMINIWYLYKLEIRSNTLVFLSFCIYNRTNTLINIWYLYKLEIRSKPNK